MIVNTLLGWLGSETNHLAIESIGTLVEVFGILIPGTYAVATYVQNSRRAERDRVLEFLHDWNAPEVSKMRSPALALFDRYNAGELTFDQLGADAKYFELVAMFLNDVEYLALFVTSEGLASYRARWARKQLSAVIEDDWVRAGKFVAEYRKRMNQTEQFGEFEKLATFWRTQAKGGVRP